MRWLRSRHTPTYLTHVSVCSHHLPWYTMKLAGMCSNTVSISVCVPSTAVDCERRQYCVAIMSVSVCVPHVVVYCEPGWCVAIVSVSVYMCHLQLFTVKPDSNVRQHYQYIQVSQEECARFRESVPYVKVYRYNPKHLYPKLNGYGDKGQRKVWSSCSSTYCTWTADVSTARTLSSVM